MAFPLFHLTTALWMHICPNADFFSLFERVTKAETWRERGLNFPEHCNSQGCAGLKPGIRSFYQSSQIGVKAPNTWTMFYCFLQAIRWEMYSQWNSTGTNGHPYQMLALQVTALPVTPATLLPLWAHPDCEMWVKRFQSHFLHPKKQAAGRMGSVFPGSLCVYL